MSFYTAASFEADSSVGYLVRRCHQLGVEGLEPVFAADGLTGMQWSALVTVMAGKASTCAELAREISYDKGATTRLVDVLQAKGWATRERDGQDRRVINLALTPAGEAIARRVKHEVIASWNDWLADWPVEDISRLVMLLQRLRDTLAARAAEGQA